MRGRKTDKDRSVTLMYLDDGSRYLVVASNSGFDHPPSWYLNLLANPAATFRTRRGADSVIARDLLGDERADVWPRLVKLNPLWAAFQSCTSRENVIVALEHNK